MKKLVIIDVICLIVLGLGYLIAPDNPILGIPAFILLAQLVMAPFVAIYLLIVFVIGSGVAVGNKMSRRF